MHILPAAKNSTFKLKGGTFDSHSLSVEFVPEGLFGEKEKIKLSAMTITSPDLTCMGKKTELPEVTHFELDQQRPVDENFNWLQARPNNTPATAWITPCPVLLLLFFGENLGLYISGCFHHVKTGSL